MNSNTRREFLLTSGGLAAATAVIGAPLAGRVAQAQAAAAPGEGAVATLGAVTKHELPPLPYAYNALEPFIDEATMKLHHDKHHAAYVTNLNAAEEALAKVRAGGDYALVQHWSRQAAFNGGGHFLHSMFWKVMAPNGQGGGGDPAGALADKIKEDFGSVEAFRAQFSAAAKAVEGAGWALLHYRLADNRLLVLQAENQHKFSQWGSLPILAIDVWEHAYYLKYKNDRAEYIKQWWNVVNWAQVEANWKALGAIATAS